MYTLSDLRVWGRKRGWCPYFLARHMMAFANVVVYNYQYMIDPKVSQMVSRASQPGWGGVGRGRGRGRAVTALHCSLCVRCGGFGWCGGAP